jgi:hypothetical protein
LLAVVPSRRLAQEHIAQVSVVTAAPGGGASGALPFAVTPPLRQYLPLLCRP